MAGHSKFANIKHRKGAQDKKRARTFSKLAKEIIVAARMGAPDPAFNPRLRGAIAGAKAVSMPRDRIQAAIKKGSGELGDGENYEEIRYEGYAPGGVALIVDCLSDNKNRSAADVRATLTKAGGSLGEAGSVAFSFQRIGMLHYPATVASPDDMFEAAVEAGADDVQSDDDIHDITCDPDAFNEVREALAQKFDDADVGRLSWKPSNTIDVDFEQAQKIMNLIDKLEDLDDVQYVSANLDVSDEVAEQLANAE
jgi:YebC/PmpR family DNA-binding regulatory protein